MELYAEFEGTVQKDHHNLLGAGALENLLGTTDDATLLSSSLQKKVADLDRDCGELCISIYDLKEATAKWQMLNLSSVIMSWDEKAVLLAKKREDYLTIRRMKLKNDIRRYDEKYFNACSKEDIGIVKGNVLDTIKLFKSEYDHVAECYKFCEDLFLDVYKYMRDVPDPLGLFESSTRMCSRANDTMKSAQDQLKLASTMLDENVAKSKSPSSSSAAMQEALKQKFERELDTFRNAHKMEVKELKSKFEIDAKIREQKLIEILQSQHADTTVHLQQAIESKDNQIATLMQQMSSLRSYNLELEERDKNYASEFQKRRDLEDKLRGVLADLSASENKNMSMKLEFESMSSRYQALEAKMSIDIQTLESTLKGCKQETNIAKAKLESAELSLRARPDEESSKRIISSLKKISGDFLFLDGGFEDEENMSFEKIEALICGAVRQGHNLAIDARLQRQEIQVELDSLHAELSACKQVLAEKNNLISSLEKDMISSHDGINNDNNNYISNSSSNNTASNNNSVGGSSSGGNSNNCNNSNNSNNSSNSSGPSSSFIQALRSQRDTFMKLASDREREIDSLKASIDTLTNNVAEMKKENLEIYSRMQNVRSGASLKSGGGEGGSSGRDLESGFDASLIKRGNDTSTSRGFGFSSDVDEDEVNSTDSIDNKYGKQYRLNSSDSADKNSVRCSSHNTANNHGNKLFAYFDSWDRFFSSNLQFALKDKMIRRLFFGYLLLVHLLAWGYVIQVINPELIEEVKAMDQNRYSIETLSIDMFTEHPDV